MRKILITEIILLGLLVLLAGCIGPKPPDPILVCQQGSADQLPIKVIASEWSAPQAVLKNETWEDAPFISPDGKTLYYSIAITETNVQSFKRNLETGSENRLVFGNFTTMTAIHTNDNSKIYFAALDAGNPEIFVNENGVTKKLENVNTPAIESEPFVSQDDQTLYFARKDPEKTNIYVSHKNTQGQWQAPQKLPETINNEQDNTQPFLHENTLYFRRDISIYASELKNGQWQTPRLIIEGAVGEPTLTANGKELYFVHIVFSESIPCGADVYKITR